VLYSIRQRLRTQEHRGAQKVGNPGQDRFEKLRGHAIYWHNCSCDLRAAAAVLVCSLKEPAASAIPRAFGLGETFRMDAALPSVYVMLCGMSLELLYKSVAVAKDLAPLHTHDLVTLAEHVGIQVDPTERGPLDLLSAAIIWSGRYPVPKTYDQMARRSEVFQSVMFEPAARPFRGLKPTRALDWSHFSRLWKTGDALYQSVVS